MFVPLEEVLRGLFHLRQISKIKQYYAIDKNYVSQRGRFSDKKHPEEQNSHEVKKIAKKEILMTIDDDKRASMTINEREQSYYTPLYGISPVSCVFSQISKSTYKLRAKFAQGYGPRSPRGTLLYNNCPQGENS